MEKWCPFRLFIIKRILGGICHTAMNMHSSFMGAEMREVLVTRWPKWKQTWNSCVVLTLRLENRVIVSLDLFQGCCLLNSTFIFIAIRCQSVLWAVAYAPSKQTAGAEIWAKIASSSPSTGDGASVWGRAAVACSLPPRSAERRACRWERGWDFFIYLSQAVVFPHVSEGSGISSHVKLPSLTFQLDPYAQEHTKGSIGNQCHASAQSTVRPPHRQWSPVRVFGVLQPSPSVSFTWTRKNTKSGKT